MAASQLSLLATRRFLPLFVTQFLAAFNDNVFKNAVVMLITYRAGHDTGVDPRILVVAAAGIFILPFLLFSATAGQLADLREKSALARKIRLLEIGVMLLAALGFFIGNYYLLLFVLFLAGTLAAFFGPIKYSILPEHLHENELLGGNALIEASTFIAILTGTIVGGVFILTTHGAHAISALLCGLAAVSWQTSKHIPPAKPADKTVRINLNPVTASRDILRTAYAEKDVFLSIIGISWFWLVGFVFLAQFPVYAKGIIGADENVVTLFLTVFSLGIGAGSMACNAMLKGRVSSRLLPLGAYGMTASIFAFWFFSPAIAPDNGGLIDIGTFLSDLSYWPLLTSLLSISVFGGIYIVPLYALMQTRCKPEHRSRTVGVNNLMNALFMVASALLTMLLLEMQIGIVTIFLLIGIINIPMTLAINRIRREIA
jgi:acyl-[acyl-carrier-protein]-phospholipid O-acyltransferase/long-chain-fatty-acid--[acyl-carrier-protein] ligase